MNSVIKLNIRNIINPFGFRQVNVHCTSHISSVSGGCTNSPSLTLESARWRNLYLEEANPDGGALVGLARTGQGEDLPKGCQDHYIIVSEKDGLLQNALTCRTF